MTDEPQPHRIVKAGLWGVGLWAALIAISIVLELLFNSGSSVGSGGMAPIPAIFLTALFLGWIPAAILSVKKYRAR